MRFVITCKDLSSKHERMVRNALEAHIELYDAGAKVTVMEEVREGESELATLQLISKLADRVAVLRRDFDSHTAMGEFCPHTSL